MDYRIVAAHLNHGIRGDEADRDETFVRDLCSRCGIDLIVERAEGLSVDTPNLEERAREARHAFLNAVADRIGADYIAVAHQADDQAETVLMRCCAAPVRRAFPRWPSEGRGASFVRCFM